MCEGINGTFSSFTNFREELTAKSIFLKNTEANCFKMTDSLA